MPTVRADNTAFLIQAAARRHQDSLTRARDALRRLDRTAELINFRAVSDAAGVSRSWLYREPTIRAEVERLRAAQTTRGPILLPVAEQANIESMQRRIETATDEIRRLKADNHELRDQVARLLGELRSTGSRH
ncbi:MAG: DUF6262 family protein [Mycobacteriales bacterium]